LASWTYLLMWFCILSLGVTGFMLGTDLYFGEEWVEEIHVQFGDALQILILLHFIGIVLDAIQFKRKTWMGMINGRK
jgi:cytochrome b